MRQTFGFQGWDPEMTDLISDEEDALDEMERERRVSEMADREIEGRELDADVHRS